ncbi:MAG: hypothetical protein JO227_04675 [Acetobacteraceae bacterium]|nr:hypothetical protein [Acetobacteraceae bacterium]
MPEPGWDAVREDLKELGGLAKEVGGKQNWLVVAQVVIALFSIGAATLSALNKSKLDEIQSQQAQLHNAITERQAEINLGTSVMHETLSILDTTDQLRFQKKAQTQLLLLNTLSRRYSSSDEEELVFMSDFYRQLRSSLAAEVQAAIKNAPASPADSALAKGLSDTLAVAQFVGQDAEVQVRRTLPAQAQTAAPSPGGATATPSAEPKIVAGEAVQPGSASGWDYDVFWCVGSTPNAADNQNEKEAEVMFRELVKRQQEGKLGRLRLRRLPEVVNQSPGYSIRNIAIRSHQSKWDKANELKRWCDQALHQAGYTDASAVVEPSSQVLNYYLSAFACAH